MIRAVLFDLDNTLLDRDQAFRDCVRERFSDPAARAELLERDDHGHGDRPALLAAWERHSGAALSLETLGSLIAERIHPDPHLLADLRALASVRKLAIVTNGGSATQRHKLRAAGLDAVIPHVWVSAEVGWAKPNPAFFHHACDQLGVLPEDCLFVGDNPDHDIAGATAAGLRARLVDAPLNRARLAQLLREEGLS